MNWFQPQKSRKPEAMIFMSGSGVNAEKLLALEAAGDAAYRISAIVTDVPDPGSSRAALLAGKFGKPLISLDIAAFYAERGLSSTSLSVPGGVAVREEWTDELRRLVRRAGAPDFGILAGFISLSDITSDFPCLNVHPGDLTVLDADGGRRYVGLAARPVEKAILAGETFLRSSVILAGGFTGKAGEVDSGPLLGISEPVAVDLAGETLDALKTAMAARPSGKPLKEADVLRRVARINLENLKRRGDLTVLPGVADDFARGEFAPAADGGILWRGQRVRTVEYRSDGTSRGVGF